MIYKCYSERYKLRNINPTNTGASHILKPSKCIAIDNTYINNQ